MCTVYYFKIIIVKRNSWVSFLESTFAHIFIKEIRKHKENLKKPHKVRFFNKNIGIYNTTSFMKQGFWYWVLLLNSDLSFGLRCWRCPFRARSTCWNGNLRTKTAEKIAENYIISKEIFRCKIRQTPELLGAGWFLSVYYVFW